MKTKTKILLTLICSLGLVASVDARWYNPSAAGGVVGVTSWTSSNHTHNSSDCISANISGVSSISFNYAVSSEANYDFFDFYIDGTRSLHIAGLGINNTFSQTITTGAHIIRFCYTKDGSVHSGTDNVIVSNISSPISSTPVSDYFPVSGSATNCPEDAQVDNIAPTNPDHTTLLGTSPLLSPFKDYSSPIGFGPSRPRQARVISGNSSAIRCQYWDATAPTASSLTYANTATAGWQNNTNIVLNWSAIDTGGSGLRNINIRVYRISGAQNTPVTLLATLLTPTNTTTYTYSGINGYAYKFEICPRDNANNVCSTWITSPDLVRVDTTNPTTINLVNTTALNLLATTSQAFTFTYNDGGSPVSIQSVFENYADPSTSVPVIAPLGFAYSHIYNQNIQNVDFDRGVNGARPYTYTVTQICDQAGNCWNGFQNYDYNIYANPNTTVTNTQDNSALTNAVADGLPRNFVHTIKDGYGNAIIPATGINRTVNMNLSAISNTMYLNQYTRLGGSSVFVQSPRGVTPVALLQAPGPQDFDNQDTVITGVYPLQVRVYTPTTNSYVAADPISDLLAGFGFTTNLVVNDTLIGLTANKTFSQILTNPSFKPLYTTSISGDLRTGGFIEGTAQTSSISITNNNLLIGVSSPELQVVFSGSNSPNFIFSSNPPNSTIGTTRVVLQSGFTSPVSMSSQLVQNAGSTVANLSNLEFSTHFSYMLDGKQVIYNSDIIGKTGGYWSNTLVQLGNQVGIKIIGPIASNAVRAIVDGQFADGTSIFGGISRADVRNKMRQSIALVTRNMQLVIVGSTVDSLTSPNHSTNDAKGAYIDKGGDSSIYKIEKTGGNVTLALASGISGKRTLVVKGANLYITKDMYYDTPDSILGVVVQKDEAGNGGNLYIDPSITNIVGTYIIDGSVMSYNGTNEIGVGDITTLKNQLYIYGSIVSENTIGGSRMSPPKCPSLLNVSCNTSELAQKYDFNYLRRYYLFDVKPFGNAKVIGGGTCTSSTSCTGFNTDLIQKFTTPADDLAKYPVIIEYNPLSRTSPPVGFELSRE